MKSLNWKRILPDPSFWILLIANIYLIYKYEQNPDIFSTLVWLYWSQSMLYGFFTALNLITNKEAVVAVLFMGHYGFFHLVYFIFLITMTELKLFDWTFFKYYLAVFFAGQAINFIQHKLRRLTFAGGFGKMLMIPYVRIIPMHLCILIPAFLSITRLTVFLVLKVFADVLMYVLTSNYYKRDHLTGMTALNIKSTIASE